VLVLVVKVTMVDQVLVVDKLLAVVVEDRHHLDHNLVLDMLAVLE
jgi:hypothetical protein